jgi:hypothetical protein
MTKAKNLFVWFMILNLFAPAGVSFAQQLQLFEDSNIFSIKTDPGGTGQETPYTLFCSRSLDNSTSTVSWSSGRYNNRHEIKIYRAEKNQNFNFNDTPRYTSSTAQSSSPYSVPPGSFSESVNANLDYQYQLKVDFTDNSGRQPTSSPVLDCPRLSQGAPSNLNVWARSSSSLFVNWKDNATAPHTFELQRIKLTPKQPAFAIDSNAVGVNREIIRAVDANTIHLNWKNDTNTTAQNCTGGTTNGICKGPFYHVIERTNCRFNNNRQYVMGVGGIEKNCSNNNPFVDNQNREIIGNPVNNITTIKKAFSEDVDPGNNTNNTKEFYGADDTNLEEGTEYFYRIKACSFIKANINKNNNEEIDICSKYADNPYYVATTTLPATPRLEFLSATASSSTFKVINNSTKADGLEIEVDPCPSGNGCTNGKLDISSSTLTLDTTEAPHGFYTKTLTGYNPGAQINIKVRAYKNNRLGPGRVYSETVEGSRITYPKLTTALEGGLGTLTPQCPDQSGNECIYSYNVPNNNGFQTVTVSVNNYSPHEFDSWTGDCNDNVCYMNQNHSITATFKKDTFTVTEIDSCTSNTTETISRETCYLGDTITCPEESTSTVNGRICKTSYSCEPNTELGCPWNYTISRNFISSLPSFKSYAYSPVDVFRLVSDFTKEIINGYSRLTKSIQFKPRVYSKKIERSSLNIAKSLRGIYDYFVALFKDVKEVEAVTKYDRIDNVRLEDSAVEQYFQQFKVDGRNSSLSGSVKDKLNLSTFEDTNVEPDTVYLYRVRACYTNNNTCTDWSKEAAGKTLPAGVRQSTDKVGICVRNNLCEMKDKYEDNSVSPAIESEQQCTVNAACQNVGTSRQFFEEVKPR